MKTFLSLIICVLVFQLASSQSLNGVISDSISQEKIPYATVVLKNNQDVFLSGTTSNDNGYYSIEQASGTYKLELSFIGFKTIKQSITIDGNTTLNLMMTEELSNLEEVVIIAEQTTVRQLIDKKVINVGKDLLSIGGNAATILNQVSEISADENGAISLRGSNNVNVLVNGKPSPLGTTELLKQINASDISQVEVITSPSAKYQANGLTGIINIITNKKIKKGVSINTSLGANTLGGYNESANVNYGSDTFNYKLGASYNKGVFKNENTQKRIGTQPYNNVRDFEFNSDVYTANAGIDWFPNKFNEFSLGIDYTDNGHTLVNQGTITQNAISTFQNTLGIHSHKTFNINGNYRHFFKNKEDFIEVDAQFSDNTNVLSSAFDPNIDALDNITDNDVFISNIAIEHSVKINNDLLLESGGLWTKQELNNIRSFTSNNTQTLNERFKNNQSTYALYSLVKYDMNKFAVQVGLRGELFNREANLITNNLDINNNFANLFPSFHVSYNINDNQSATFGYNRRTSRPSLDQVNPIILQLNEFYMDVGNPSLQPEYSNNIDLNYSLRKDVFSFNTSLSYRSKENVITTTNILNSEGVNVYMPINSGKTDAFGTELSLTVKPKKWFNSTLNFSWYYEKFKEDQIGFTRNFNRSYNFSFKNNFKISNKTKAVLSWRYNGNEYNFQDIQIVNQQIDLALSHKILKNKGSINLRITDIFNTREYGGTDTGIGFSEQYQFKPVSQVAHISFSYQIDKVSKKRNKKDREYDSGIID